MQRVLVLNGPNLNLLGTREPEVYGATTLADLERNLTAWGERLGLEVAPFQSNHEGALIDRLHDQRKGVDGVVINAGALTHTSYALHDAIVATSLPTVEVHISNVMKREAWRRHSVIAPACLASIYGRGITGYRDAMRALVNLTTAPPEPLIYGETEHQVMDLRIPAGAGPHPVGIFLHGGFWRGEWGRDTIDTLAVALYRRGWMTANVEYRRLDTGGGWPISGVDVLDAIETLQARSDVDPDRLVLVGHSAGAQLALTAAAAATTPPALVVGLAPITDLAAAHAEGLDGGIVELYMDGAPEDREAAYSAASPIASPSPSLHRLMIHGDADTLVPASQSRSYVTAAAAAGAEVEYVELAGAGHFHVLDPGGEAWAHVLRALPN